MSHIVKILLIIGGLNWGLIGLGMFIGKNLNFLALLSQFYPDLPAIIYCVIGVSAIWLIVKRP